MKYRKLVKQLNNLQLFRIFMERRNKTVRIKTKKKAFVSVLLSFVMIMGLFFVPKVNAEEQPDQPNTISFKTVKADMQNVDVYLEINGQTQNSPVSYAPGLITDYIDSIKDHIGETTFQKAVVRNVNNGQITENEIVRVGKYNGNIYYSLTDDEDTGIGLEENERIVLIFSSSYSISYNLTPSNGGTYTGNSEAYYGQEIPITVKSNETYKIENISYTVEYNTTNVEISNSLEMQFKIPKNTITSNVEVNINFIKDTEYHVIGISNSSGGICQDQGKKGDYLDPDEEQEITPVLPGEDKTFMLYSQSWTGGDEYYLNALSINGEEVTVPNKFEVGSWSKTTLKNGSEVTVTLFKKNEGLYWKQIGDYEKDGYDRPVLGWKWEKERCLYNVTITNVRSDIEVDWNFKASGSKTIMLKGSTGIKNIGAASESYYSEISGTHFKYGLQEYSSSNVYKAYHQDDIPWYFPNPGVSYNIYLYSIKSGYNPYSAHVKVDYYDSNGFVETKKADNIDGNLEDYSGLIYHRDDGRPVSWTTVNNIQQTLQTNHRHFSYDDYDWTTDLINNGYQYGFAINQSTYDNQLLELSVDPYQYNLIFDLNDGSGLNSNEYQETDDGYIEIKDGEKIIYTLENGSVNTYMPLDTPQKDGKTFLGWKLCDSNGNELDKIYSENELFVINEDTIQYATGDVKQNENHTFTFKAIWGDTTDNADTAVYSIEVYKENQDGTVEVDNSNKKYSLHETYNFVGIVNKRIAFLGEENKYNPDSNLYVINDDASKYEIAALQDDIDANPNWEENNVIRLYFDYQRYNLTVTKDAVGDYADLTKQWNINVTLTNGNDADLSNKTFTYNNETVTLSNGNACLSLKDGESFTFTGLIKETLFTIKETNQSNDYTISYNIKENYGETGESLNEIKEQSLSSNKIVTVINTMKDINIPDTNIPTSGMNNTITMLAIGSLGIIGIVTLLWYWRKKHV